MSNIGERLRECRLKKRIKQDELADYVGVTTKTIWRWETLAVAPDANKMKLLADALDTTVAYLAGETDNPQRGSNEATVGEESGPNNQHISQATLDLEAMIKDLAYEYPDLAIGFRDTRRNWGSLSDNDKESIAEALMMVFKPESYVPKRLKREGRFGGKV